MVELLAVIALVALLAGLGLGATRLASDPSDRVRVAAHHLLFTFHLARSRAILLREPVYLDFAPGEAGPADGLYTAWVDLDRDRAPDPGEHVASRIALSARLDGLPVEPLPRGVRFGPGHLEQGPNGTVAFPDGIGFSGGVDRIGFYPRGHSSAGTCYLSDRRTGTHVWAVRALLSGTFESWSWQDGRWVRES